MYGTVNKNSKKIIICWMTGYRCIYIYVGDLLHLPLKLSCHLRYYMIIHKGLFELNHSSEQNVIYNLFVFIFDMLWHVGLKKRTQSANPHQTIQPL